MAKNSFKFFACGEEKEFHGPILMGILNATPDSFFSPNCFQESKKALLFAEKMVKAGAQIIDIGGESTSQMAKLYGAKKVDYLGLDRLNTVSEQEEVDRVIPIVEIICKNLDCLISIDTSSPLVMQAAADAGAHIINDIRFFQRPGAVDVMLKNDLAMVVCHSLGEHPDLDFIPQYQDVCETVKAHLTTRINALKSHQINSNRIIIYPGFGGGIFGKTVKDDIALLKNIQMFSQMNYPLLVGMSRKSFIGQLTNSLPENRLSGSLACALLAAQSGASIIRVHDVEETAKVLQMYQVYCEQ